MQTVPEASFVALAHLSEPRLLTIALTDWSMDIFDTPLSELARVPME